MISLTALLTFIAFAQASLDPSLYIKQKLTSEGEHLKDYLEISDIKEDEQALLPQSLVTAFKLVSTDWNVTKDIENMTSEEYVRIKEAVLNELKTLSAFNIRRVEILAIKNFKQLDIPVIFGYIGLKNEEDYAQFEIHLKENITNKYIGNITISRGMALNTQGVEKNSVVHLALQLWKEPWPYGMENEASETRKNTSDVMLHLIQPRFRMIFGEHYYRTIISDISRTPDSTVVHAYILIDPDKDNLYHSSTIWFSSNGYVSFGKWILFPSNVMVERAVVVPNRYWKYLSDRSYFAPKAFEKTSLYYTITLPAALSILTIILAFMALFSLCHWLAYTRGARKTSLVFG